MVTVYSDADFLAVYKQKKRIFGLFLGVTAVYLAFCIAWLLYYITLPYKAPEQDLPKACVYVGTALYVIFAFPYMAIKYSRVKRYYKMLSYVSDGLKNEEKNYFYCFEKPTLQKDNIDVVFAVFETWNKKKQEWMDREVYCDIEKSLPPFESGDYVQYVTQSNFIIQYTILQKKALEFEEIEEDEYDEEQEEYEENEDSLETEMNDSQENV